MPLAVAAAIAASTGSTTMPGDDLTRIRAIDPETARRLRALGVNRFSDIAVWTAGDVLRMSQALGFAGRIEQENWVGQAQVLVKGSDAAAAPRVLRPANDTVAPSAPVALPESAGVDRLHRIFGIDAATEKLLVENGVTRFADIAAWTSRDIEKAEALLGKPGRVGLENWIGQAKILAGAGGNVALLKPAVQAAAPSAPPSPQPAPAAEVRPAPAPAVQAAPAPSAVPPAGSSARPDFAGLRSVRSEALRREPLRAQPTLGHVDDLKRIRGVGVLIEKKLNSLGVTSYEQIANWTGADIDKINQILDFKGRIERENWVEQARILASGGGTEFSRRADRGEFDTSRNRFG